MNRKFVAALVLIVILVIVIIVIVYRKEKFASPASNTISVNPNNYLISDDTGNLLVTNSGAFDTVGANSIVTSGLTVNGPLQADTLQLNNHPVYPADKTPFVLGYAVGSYKGPIYGIDGQTTYSPDEWTLKVNNGSNIAIGVRSNMWWITRFPGWDDWTYGMIEFIPVPLSQYYSSYTSHPAITQDTELKNGWLSGPVNTNSSSLIVIQDSKNQTTIAASP